MAMTLCGNALCPLCDRLLFAEESLAALPAIGDTAHPLVGEQQKVWGSGDKRSSAGFPLAGVINLVPAIAPHFLLLSEASGG